MTNWVVGDELLLSCKQFQERFGRNSSSDSDTNYFLQCSVMHQGFV